MRELDRELRELGGRLQWPRTPDVAAAVAERVRPPARRRLPRAALVLALLAAALAAAVAEPTARSAILELLRIGGVTVERREPPAELPAERVAPGRRVTLAEAEEAAPFPLVVPSDYRSVHLSGAGRDAIVTFVWDDRLLSQFRGDELLLLKKAAPDDTAFEWLEVEGALALWIEGAPHGLFLPGGEARLAGNVLIWVRDGVTFRLEGDVRRAEAVAFAGTFGRSGT